MADLTRGNPLRGTGTSLSSALRMPRCARGDDSTAAVGSQRMGNPYRGRSASQLDHELGTVPLHQGVDVEQSGGSERESSGGRHRTLRFDPGEELEHRLDLAGLKCEKDGHVLTELRDTSRILVTGERIHERALLAVDDLDPFDEPFHLGSHVPEQLTQIQQGDQGCRQQHYRSRECDTPSARTARRRTPPTPLQRFPPSAGRATSRSFAALPGPYPPHLLHDMVRSVPSPRGSHETPG